MTKRSKNSKGNATPEVDKIECNVNQTHGTNNNTQESSRTSVRHKSKHSTKSGCGSASILLKLDPEVLTMVDQLGSEDDDDDAPEEGFFCRKYHIFCFCCCDIRRACIILNCVHMMLLIFLVFFVNMRDQIGVPIFEDDVFQEEVEGIYEKMVLRSCIGIPVSIVGVVGAYRFQPWPVLLMSVWLVAYVVWQMAGKRYFNAAFAVFLAVPELCLFFALREGKINRDHYESQKRCCCPATKIQQSIDP